jgi:hypothetical protein
MWRRSCGAQALVAGTVLALLTVVRRDEMLLVMIEVQ